MISTYMNGVTSALSMGPSVRYNLLSKIVKCSIILVLVGMVHMYVLATITSISIIYVYIHIFAKLVCYFQNKLNMKIPKFQTIQTPAIRQIFLLHT